MAMHGDTVCLSSFTPAVGAVCRCKAKSKGRIEVFNHGVSPHTNTIVITAEIESGFASLKMTWFHFTAVQFPHARQNSKRRHRWVELLPDNTTINLEVYCHQLDKLNDALQQKRSELINRKGVVFHQDNARPHISLVTRQKLLQLEWDTMPHPPYSPDLAPSDYYLFRSLQNLLDGKTFTLNEEVKNHLDQFIASKDQKFYERGIMLLPERRQKITSDEAVGCTRASFTTWCSSRRLVCRGRPELGIRVNDISWIHWSHHLLKRQSEWPNGRTTRLADHLASIMLMIISF
ncbi:histone-lysine N-methyltransferase SETMAR [Trichonephila clavipes]|nr:histone-lysine N-methyltransferase SETMAR [Trichonephila clavipes]